MRVDGSSYRTIWCGNDGWSVEIIDQTRLPHAFETLRLTSLDDAADAIAAMKVRGAPLIGVTAAYGMCLAVRQEPSMEQVCRAAARLLGTRPTAVNLQWALDEMVASLEDVAESQRVAVAYEKAAQLASDDVELCRCIGEYGLTLIQEVWRTRERSCGPVNVLTHCNAGWLATVDWGTALAPVYMAHDAGIPVHVWVDETRPRNQGASLTAWELGQHGVPHSVIADNTGGHLMQRGMVDLCFVGTDRTTAHGDVCNKIGTYLKALAAHDNGVPFYVCAPSPSIDFSLSDGVKAIPIEQRSEDEVHRIRGLDSTGRFAEVRVTPEGCKAANFAFDVTPARLVTALVTERGVCSASRAGLASLFADRVQ